MPITDTIEQPNSQTADRITASTIIPQQGNELLRTPRTIISERPAVEDINKIKGQVDEISVGMEAQRQRLAEAQPQVSVVDYLASQGQPSSFSERAKLAQQIGISNYTGTADQNTRLLAMLQSRPPQREQTPEEKRTAEMGQAIRDVFTPEQYQANPYWKRPDETDEEYNQRVEALRTSGIPEEDEEPVETPEQQFSKQLEDYANRIDEAYNTYTSDMNKLRAGDIPLTPEEEAQMSNINRIFDELKAQQLTANKNFEKATEIAGIAAGRQRYAPEVHLGNVKKAVDDGLKKISELETKRLTTINDLKMAIRDKNYKQIGDTYDRFMEYSAQKTEALKGVYELAAKERDRVDEIVKEQIKLLNEEKKRIETEKNKIMSDATKNGAPQSVISAIGEAENIADAFNIAGEYLQSGTGIVGEYLYYKRDQERQGLVPVDFNTYQTIDANRKAKAQSLISGLDPKIASQVDALSKGYDSSPIVKQFNDVLNKKISIDYIIDNSSGGPGDLALVFEFMKSLDPTSVVRESEYDVASKSGNPMKRVAAKIGGYFSEGQFLPEEVREEFRNITRLKFDAIKRQYDNIRKETARKINMKTGDIDGTDYLTDYDISISDIAEDIKDKVDDLIIASPELAEVVKQLYLDGKTDEDVYNYLMNTQ